MLPGLRAGPMAGLLLGWDDADLPRLALLTMSQKVVGRQEGFSWNRSPVLRPWLQAHVDPLAGSPAVKLLIVKHLEESRYQEEEANPRGE